MQANQQDGLHKLNRVYSVDIVFCIDATGSMEDVTGKSKKLINMVKENALHFHDDLSRRMAETGRSISQLRVRVIAFRDYLADGDQAMLVTNFFNLPQQAADFEACINSITTMGGGDEPEDGLEALAYAIRSDWNKRSWLSRHVIVVWSDAGTHPLGYARGCEEYPQGMPASMDELTEWWDEMPIRQKRMILFAPNEEGWKYISDNWDNVAHVHSAAGNGLGEQTYSQILDRVVYAV